MEDHVDPQGEPGLTANGGASFEAFSKIRARLPRFRNVLLKRSTFNEPSILSASRAPAAEVLKATQIPETSRAPSIPERLSDIPKTAANALPDVPALHTFKGDIADTIARRNISLADIAQAQAGKQEVAPNSSNWLSGHWVSILLVGSGTLFGLAAIGILLVSFLHFAPTPSVTPAVPSIIYLDETKTIVTSPQESRNEFMQALAETQGESIPLGLVEQLAITVASSVPSATAPMDARGFFNTIAPSAPDALVRSLSTEFLLGLHSYSGNQPFLIFKTDAYTQAYAGMLSWESTMQQDLAPLFPISVATSSATSTSSVASSTASAIVPTPFADAVIDNHEARVLRDQSGNTELLWSFIDPQTLVIATNANTLAEIVSRLQKAPTITIPGN